MPDVNARSSAGRKSHAHETMSSGEDQGQMREANTHLYRVGYTGSQAREATFNPKKEEQIDD